MAQFTLEELMAEKQRRQQAKSAPQQRVQPQQPQGQDINALIQTLTKAQQPTLTQNVGDALTRLGGGTPTPRKDYTDLIVKEQLERSRPKTELELLIEKGKAAEAAKNLGDRNTFNALQSGGTTQPQAKPDGQQAEPNQEYESLIGDEGAYLNQIDPFTGKPTPRGAEAQARLRLKVGEEGAKNRANAKTQQTIKDLSRSSKMIERDLDDVLTTWNEIPKSVTGPIQGRTTGQVAKFLQFGKGGRGLSEYDDTVDFIMANVSRQLGGERGVLTDADIMRIKRALPQSKDKSGVASNKIARIKRFIQRRIEAASAGELPGFGADMEDELSEFAGNEADAQINNLLDTLGAE